MIDSSRKLRHPLWLLGGVLICFAVLAPLLSTFTNSFAQEVEPAAPDVFDAPTTSSPITMSQDKNFIWVVNPDDGSVTVLGNLGTTPSRLTTIQNVGREPQAVALDTANRAYVVSPPDNGVKVIDITNANPATFRAVPRSGFLTTGAEPWNLVAAPDGGRIFVANSGQDTITVIRTSDQTIVGSVDLRNSLCNVDDQTRTFQPRGLAVTLDGTRLYVARFLSYTKPGGVQGVDGDKEGVVCQLDIPADVNTLPVPTNVVRLAAFNAGFNQPNGTPSIAHPNQLQSIVIRDDQVYLPNIAAATQGPDRFNSSTMAFVNVVDNAKADGVGVDIPADAPNKAVNLHLGARVPEAGKKKLFFANPWAMAFTNQSGAGNAYVVSAGSDLLVKLDVDASGELTFTNGVSTTRYIDLNDPALVATNGRNAGKNPLGIVIRENRAFVMNYISRNVSVVNLDTDTVENAIETSALPGPGSFDEELLVGKEIFFSSRGHFDRPGGTTVSTDERLSSEGWQNCASCHFAGLTDGNVWFFGSGPRKSIPLNASWSPHNPDDQRLLNYSAIFDEVQDFELNVRNTSGPGALAVAQPCSDPAPGAAAVSALDPNHGLILGDTNNNLAPCVVNQFAKPNAGRQQVKVTLPGSTTAWPALDAMKEWVRFSIRTPEGALTEAQLPVNNQQGALDPSAVSSGRRLFFRAGCHTCHGGTKWTISNKDFDAPPAGGLLTTETITGPIPVTGVVPLQMFIGLNNDFLKDIASFNLNVAGQANTIPGQLEIGAREVSNGGLKALGFDHNGDGKGQGYNIPALLGIAVVPPYYHNGACESLACVLNNVDHRTAGLRSGQSDPLVGDPARANLVAWLETLDNETPFPLNLSIRRHDIFFDPPRILKGSPVTVGANISLFGTKADLADLLTDLVLSEITVNLEFDIDGDGTPEVVPLSLTPDLFNQDFGQAVITTTVDIPSDAAASNGAFTFVIDPANQVLEADENDNQATRSGRLRNPPADRTAPVIVSTLISDEDPFNDLDAITTSTAVRVKITANDPDPDGAEAPSGLASYCIVRYRFNVARRFWEETDCTFEALPAPEVDGSFIVDQTIPSFGGVVYAFVWVRDNAGNISRRPSFAFISFIPEASFRLNRNDVRLFRIPLAPGASQTLSFTPLIGDVDVSVFDDFRSPNATRIELSANNGAVCEDVVLTGQAGQPNRFQVEVRAIVNSQVLIELAPCEGVVTAATTSAPTGIHQAADKPLVAGPPLRAAIEDTDTAEANTLFLPIVGR